MATLYLGVEAKDDRNGIDGCELLDRLVARLGSVPAAAEIIGIAERNVQRWAQRQSTPRPSSVERMWAALDGDDIFVRNDRIRRYAARAERRRPLFVSADRRPG